jgi:hypothetical protein
MTTMEAFRVIPIADDIAGAVRATLVAPGYGHPAHVEVATGYGPCRTCLRTFREGRDERVLFTHDAFAGVDAYPSPGPMFIHRDACEPWRGDGFPPEVAALPLMLEAYGAGRWPVAREPARGALVEPAVARLLANPAVAYLHVRNAEAGCYIARVERA